MKKRYLPVAMMLMFAGSTAFAANGSETEIYGAMDANDDDRVSEKEFSDYFMDSGIYDTWDVDGDGVLDEEEFGAVLYDYYDDDDDGYIDDAEWEDGIMVDDAGDEGFWDV